MNTVNTDWEVWLESLQSEGWLNDQDAMEMRSLTHDGHETAFVTQSYPPLVVALLGGTGTGKSSLLNRIAGQSIATTGITRPTSTDVVIHLHTETLLSHLPEGLATSDMRMNRHQQANLKHLVLIDTPDIDSMEERHHEITHRWLKTVDVVIYVVSPERYRDHKGWHLLQRESQQYGWIFCFNQWDRADPTQWVDFLRIIHEEGFDHPLCFRTESTSISTTDDFNELMTTLRAMSEACLPEQLAIHRKKQLQSARIALMNPLNERFAAARLADDVYANWHDTWRSVSMQVVEGLAWHFAPCVEELYLGRLSTLMPGKDTPSPLWDEYADMISLGCMRQYASALTAEGLPIKVVGLKMNPLLATMATTVCGIAESHLRKALASPGGRVRKALHRSFSLLSLLLPALGTFWVGWVVVSQFYLNSQSGTAWLESAFAIHSALLVGILWLLPWLLARVFLPASNVDSAGVKALAGGIRSGLDKLAMDIREVTTQIQREALQHEKQLHDFKAQMADEKGLSGDLHANAQHWLEKIMLGKS